MSIFLKEIRKAGGKQTKADATLETEIRVEPR